MRQIVLPSAKAFMTALLKTDTFDLFELAESVVRSDASYMIDGHAPDGSGVVLSYEKLRDVMYAQIRGKQTPQEMKLVFLYPRERLSDWLSENAPDYSEEDIANLSLVIRFKDGSLSAVSGTTLAAFSLDRSVEEAWDRWIQSFLEPFLSA